MEDPRWLRLVTIGLVLAALAVGYFLLSGRLSPNNNTKPASQATKSVPSPVSTASASPAVVGRATQATPTPTATPVSAYGMIVDRNQAKTQGSQTLPNTGFPVGLVVVISVATMISGWGLRKFPY